MLLAIEHITTGVKTSGQSPHFAQIRAAKDLYLKYRRYLKREPLEPYVEIGFLPLGDALGYNNHPAYMIEELELVRDCFNEITSRKQKAGKHKKGRKK